MSLSSGIRAGRAFVEIFADSGPMEQTLSKIRGKLAGFGAGLATLGGGLLGAAAGAGGALTWPLMLAANLQQTRIAFETMLKSGQAADALLKDLKQFAASTPFEFTEIANAAKKLLAFGSSAGEIKKELTMLGDIASGVGVPIGDLAEIYGKARVAGRLFAEDVNQLSGRGIAIIEHLAASMGVSKDQVMDLVSAGKVGFPELQAAMKSLVASDFAGMMDKQSQSLIGRMSTLKDAIVEMVLPIGEALLPAMQKLTEYITAAVAVLEPFIKANSQITIYVAAGAAAVGAIGAALLGMSGIVYGGVAVLGALKLSLAALFSPLGLIVAGAIAITTAVGGWPAVFAKVQEVGAGALGWLKTEFGAIGETFTAVWNGLSEAISSGNMEAAFEIETSGLNVAWLQLIQKLHAPWMAFVNTFKNMWTDAVTWIAKAGLSVVYSLEAAWDSLSTSIAQSIDWILSKLQMLWKWISGGSEEIANLQSELDARMAGRSGGLDDRADARAKEEQAVKRMLDEMANAEKAARESGSNQAIKTAEDKLRQAQANFEKAVTLEEKQQKDRQDKIDDAAKKSGAGSTSVSGQFNASLAGQQLGLNRTQDRIAKASEASLKELQSINGNIGGGIQVT